MKMSGKNLRSTLRNLPVVQVGMSIAWEEPTYGMNGINRNRKVGKVVGILGSTVSMRIKGQPRIQRMSLIAVEALVRNTLGHTVMCGRM